MPKWTWLACGSVELGPAWDGCQPLHGTDLLAYPFPICDCALCEGHPGVCVYVHVCRLGCAGPWAQGCALMCVHVRPVS